MIGTKLAHYEITAHLGSGGMGDVYQATDLKLKRSVAIKFLPSEFSSDAERLSRFRREAQLLASLNHPTIAHIYGLEEFGDKRCIVMELIEGETLQTRLRSGALPVDEALGIAKQICEALEAAHEKGVIHRDLKPGNVMVTADGKVKVLDFGLAKAFEQDTSAENLSNSPTMMSGGSMAGLIVGTAAYMSPEQARGRKVDRRTDIFAFGCVLYEMLTAKRAFDGEDLTEILGRVVTAEPDWTLLPASVPPAVQKLLYLCVEKNLKYRRSDATDVRIDVEQALKEPLVLPSTVPSRRHRLGWTALVAIFVVTLIFGLGIGSRLKNTVAPSAPAIQFTVPAPSGQSVQPRVSVSSDGHWLAFETGSPTSIWLRPTDSVEPHELAGTHGAGPMFWSPDSKQLAFFADHELKTTEVLTGFSHVLTEVPGPVDGNGGDWSTDGVILFGCLRGIYKIAAVGGVASRVDLADGAEAGSVRTAPRFLPDGEHFLYAVPKAAGMGGLLEEAGIKQQFSIQVASIKSPESRPLLETESSALYVPSGYVLFVRGGTLWAQSFDSEKLNLIGEAQPLAQPVEAGAGTFSTSQGGILSFVPKSAGHNSSDLVWVDNNGNETGKLKKAPTGISANPSISPDGRRVAVNSLDPQTRKADIWIVDSTREVAERFTLGGGSNKDPVWSPDGQQIAFASDRENHFGLYVKSLAGAASEQLVAEVPVGAIPTDWSSDGKFIVYTSGGDKRLWLLSLSDQKSKRLIPTVESSQTDARFSRDGKWIAYSSDELGKDEVYIQDFPSLARKHQISDAGGFHPRWGKDDSAIYYHAPGAHISVAVLRKSGADLVPEAPRVAFDRPVPMVGDNRNQYAITADGQRFLLRQPSASGAPITSLTVIVNWLATLHK